jgi:hypothetical protein
MGALDWLLRQPVAADTIPDEVYQALPEEIFDLLSD